MFWRLAVGVSFGQSEVRIRGSRFRANQVPRANSRAFVALLAPARLRVSHCDVTRWRSFEWRPPRIVLITSVLREFCHFSFWLF